MHVLPFNCARKTKKPPGPIAELASDAASGIIQQLGLDRSLLANQLPASSPPSRVRDCLGRTPPSLPPAALASEERRYVL